MFAHNQPLLIMKKLKTHQIEILLIEIIPKNIEIITEMLNKTKFQYKLHISENINERLNFLSLNGNARNSTKPDMIFVNSELASNYEKNIIARKNGYSNIPVLFLNITNNEIEIAKAIDKHINYQSTKMHDIKYFIETIVSLKEFVGSLVKLPKLATLLENPVKLPTPSMA